MAKELILPKLGNTVESCIILEWRVKEGDTVQIGDVVCEAETDKTTVEVESEVEGTLLKILVEEGDEADVLSNLAIVGESGEDISSFVANNSQSDKQDDTASSQSAEEPSAVSASQQLSPLSGNQGVSALPAAGSSPRARNSALRQGLDLSILSSGSGPAGRIIERDVLNAVAGKAPLTPAAKAQSSGKVSPQIGSGLGGRVLMGDLRSAGTITSAAVVPSREDKVIPLKGVRKIVAQRMLASLNEAAQLTHNSSADAVRLLELRKRFKGMDNESVASISLNDLILYATAQTLNDFAYMNAHFLGDRIVEKGVVNLGFAVDTPRGLMVPVIRNAGTMNILEISAEATRLIMACREGTIDADELKGGTFTLSNLGGFGVESFTPVINRPEVAILGVCNIQPKPVMKGDDVDFIPHLGLSITYDHQAVDGAPAARFMKKLGENIADIDLLIAGLC